MTAARCWARRCLTTAGPTYPMFPSIKILTLLLSRCVAQNAPNPAIQIFMFGGVRLIRGVAQARPRVGPLAPVQSEDMPSCCAPAFALRRDGANAARPRFASLCVSDVGPGPGLVDPTRDGTQHRSDTKVPEPEAL